MKVIECRVKNRDCVIKNVAIADTFFSRLIGLMFLQQKDQHALLLKGAPSIHTCFMFFSLDVLFLDSQKKIIKIFRSVNPWKMTGFYFKSAYVLEIPIGQLSSKVEVGDSLEFDYV